MEKIINIDGRDVRFRSTAALPLLYKAQFGRDFFRDFNAIRKSWNVETESFIDGFDVTLIYDIIWVTARCADKTISLPIDWYDEFDDFPVFEVFGDLVELITQSFAGTRKNRQATVTRKRLQQSMS